MRSLEPETFSAEFGVDHECCGVVREGDCLDLLARFGRTYMIDYEDPVFRGSRCPWHVRIICRGGWVAPSDGTKLYGYARRRRKIRLKLRELALTQPERYRIAQEGDSEIGIIFDVEHFAPVAAILKPVRR